MKLMTNNIKSILYAVLISVSLIACNKNKNPETASQPENNGVDISFNKSDTTVTLNLFYTTLKEINIVDVLLNGKKISYTKSSDESVVFDSKTLSLGRNTVLFIYKKKDIIDTIQKDLFNTLKIDYSIEKSFKHHSQYFTEGLIYDENNCIIESMGMEGKSRIVFYNNSNNSPKVKDSIINEAVEFGEGLSIHKNNLVQLLWKNGYLKIFDKKTHKLIKDLEFKTEGWGLCNNGDILYASNGSSTINIIDISGPTTQIVKSINVQDSNGPVLNINELEYINGYLYANVWQTDLIIIFNPNTGDVVGRIDLSDIATKERELNLSVDVLNGIAYNKKNKTLLVTGKYWANFYEIKLKNSLPNI